tara:strand:+ start:5590 stop:5952 length:363 start_codon:yes stop_codon:yes gene_type:complete
MIKKLLPPILKPFSSLSYRVVNCPSCQKKCRFPIKKNQTLRITCPNCSGQFDISIVNPITAILSGKTRFKDLPKQEKLKVAMLLISTLILVLMIIGAFFAEPMPTKKYPDKSTQTEDVLI